MRDKLDALLREGLAKIEAASSEAELQDVKAFLLGWRNPESFKAI